MLSDFIWGTDKRVGAAVENLKVIEAHIGTLKFEDKVIFLLLFILWFHFASNPRFIVK